MAQEMAKREVSLSQIAEKLNALFAQDTGERKLIFWFDATGEFQGDIEELAPLLSCAKLWKLTGKNQFQTKYLLEREYPQDSFLIYAPFARPSVKENHLEDMILYSEVFQADRMSILMQELGIPEAYRPTMDAYQAFWKSKERTKAFAALSMENYEEDTLLLGMVCVLTKVKSLHFDEVLYHILSGNPEESAAMADFQKFGLLEYFWKRVERQFGYHKEHAHLSDFVISLFATYASKEWKLGTPSSWEGLTYPDKVGNVMAFLDGCMNNETYSDMFDHLSDQAGKQLLSWLETAHVPVEKVSDCHVFRQVEQQVISWLYGRLLAEDLKAELGGLTISSICQMHEKTHFGRQSKEEYEMLRYAYLVLAAMSYQPGQDTAELVSQYQEKDYVIDQAYRKFYMYYDGLSENENRNRLRQLVENVYTNRFLGELLPKWNRSFGRDNSLVHLLWQKDFFSSYLQDEKEKTVVILSDALRYEVGRELFDRLCDNPKAKVSLSYMMATLPSYTRLGMTALLPHKELSLSMQEGKLQEKGDGMYCISTDSRRQLLQSYAPDADCVDMETVRKAKNRDDLRQLFTGKRIIYVYHDEIDTTGENNPEKLFRACEDALRDILSLMQKLSTSGNVYKFIVTADHGFLYKRDGFQEGERIDTIREKDAVVKRRFILSNEPVQGDGICHLPLSEFVEKSDKKYVSFPLGMNVFRASGGLSYVHGGSSPQELMVPVIQVKFDKYHVDTQKVTLELLSNFRVVTNRYVILDFLQQEPVTSDHKAAHYLLYFISDSNEKVSNENLVMADRKEKDVQKRYYKLQFQMKDMYFDPQQTYYLQIEDADTGETVYREPFRVEMGWL